MIMLTNTAIQLTLHLFKQFRQLLSTTVDEKRDKGLGINFQIL